MKKLPNAAPVWIFGLAIAALLTACAKNPSETDTSAKDNDAAIAAQEKSDSEAAAMLLPAYQLNRDASSRQRLVSMKSTASEPAIEPAGKLPAFGPPPAGSGKALSAKPQPNIATALLKRGLGKTSAAADADTAYFVYDDSTTKGTILWVHAYALTEAGTAVDAKDSITYKWPYSLTNRTVLAHSGTRVYLTGAKLRYVVSDEDGDKILNEAVAGKKVQLHKLWITEHGDTTWKSIKHTTHGSTNYYDSLGEGSPTSWTDSVHVAGKVVSWQRIYDTDGDGFILTAAAGAKVKVSRDSYSEVGGGVFRLDYEAFGPGADGKFLEVADNERYPWRSLTVDGSGKDVSASRYGDGDGDGFYWNPASVSNKAWGATDYAVNDSVKEYTDSLEQLLSGPGGADAKITFYSSKRKYVDGRNLTTYTRLPGKDGFGAADTVQVWEKLDLSTWNSKAEVDSTLRVTWMVPGALGDPSDDKIAMWYSQVWNRAGIANVSTSEMLTADAPYAPADAPKAGTYVREDRTNPVSSKSVIRTVLFKEFDVAQGSANWRRTNYFENGDSTVSMGGGVPGGAGTYTQALGRGAKNSGFYDAATGEFEDTTAMLGFTGEAKSKEIAWGKIDAAKGTGDYHTKRLTGKDTATAHVVVKADGEGFLMTRTTVEGTTQITFKGDSAAMAKTDGSVKRTYTWSSGSGAYRVTEKDEDVKSGASLATGEYFFGQDLSGAGACKKTPPGKAAVESKVQFQSDGSVFQDGVKVTP